MGKGPGGGGAEPFWVTMERRREGHPFLTIHQRYTDNPPRFHRHAAGADGCCPGDRSAPTPGLPGPQTRGGGGELLGLNGGRPAAEPHAWGNISENLLGMGRAVNGVATVGFCQGHGEGRGSGRSVKGIGGIVGVAWALGYTVGGEGGEEGEGEGGADIRSGWQEGCRGGGGGGPVDPGANHRQAGKPTPMKPPIPYATHITLLTSNNTRNVGKTPKDTFVIWKYKKKDPSGEPQSTRHPLQTSQNTQPLNQFSRLFPSTPVDRWDGWGSGFFLTPGGRPPPLPGGVWVGH